MFANLLVATTHGPASVDVAPATAQYPSIDTMTGPPESPGHAPDPLRPALVTRKYVPTSDIEVAPARSVPAPAPSVLWPYPAITTVSPTLASRLPRSGMIGCPSGDEAMTTPTSIESESMPL